MQGLIKFWHKHKKQRTGFAKGLCVLFCREGRAYYPQGAAQTAGPKRMEAAEMEHKTLATPGGTVHYWLDRAGPGAPCLVFTHGLTSDHRMLAPLAARFRGRATLLLWDVPLHGRSRPYTGFSFCAAADALEAILRREQLPAVVLIGISMGGYLGQQFAARYPGRVRALAALSTVPMGQAFDSWPARWVIERLPALAGALPAGLLRWWIARSSSATRPACEAMRAMTAPRPKAELVEQIRAVYGAFLRENQPAALHCPVLILAGERDWAGRVKHYNRAWARRTGYPLHWIRGAGHYVSADNPAQV